MPVDLDLKAIMQMTKCMGKVLLIVLKNSVEATNFRGSLMLISIQKIGQLFYKNGERYEGEFKNGLRDGQGKIRNHGEKLIDSVESITG